MQRQTMLAVILVLLGIVGATQFALASEPGPKPALKTPEKPSEVEQRTMPKPGKPESEQPPPDAVGKVPPDLKQAGKENETSKLLPKTKDSGTEHEPEEVEPKN
jgi:hypothetical protein